MNALIFRQCATRAQNLLYWDIGMSVTTLQRVLRVCDFGLKPVKYAEAVAVQEKLADLCKRKEAPDTLLQLQVG